MFRKKKPRLSGGSEAEASLYARWIRESIPRAIRLHNAIGSGPFEGLFYWKEDEWLNANLRTARTPSLDGKSTAPTDAVL